MKITKLETFLVKPRWLFLKMHTDEGLVGLGEPILEGRALTCAQAVAELEPYLIGKDPRRVVHHWQAMYRHAFYRGGPILTSALSGVEQALWDLAGKAADMPIYEMLGGPLRDRIKMYKGTGGGGTPEQAAAAVKERKEQGFIAIKTGPAKIRPARIVETPAFIDRAVETFAAMREAGGPDFDIAIDFHGAISPQTAAILIKALEPYQPMFVEEPIQCQDIEGMAELARKTHLPIATGERIFTKWGFRDLLEKRACSIIQPDLSHAGGIFETRLIAGMAESYYAAVARTVHSAPSPWPPASNSTPAYPTSSHKNTPCLAKTTSKNRSNSKTATSNCPKVPALALNSTTTKWKTKLATTGPIKDPFTQMTDRSLMVTEKARINESTNQRINEWHSH